MPRLLLLLRLLRLWLRRAGLAERVTRRRAYTADSTLSNWLTDSRLLALRIERLLHIRGSFLERIPDEFPLNVLLAVVVDLLRRRIDFAGDTGQKSAKNRAVYRACRFLQVRGISHLTVQRTEWTLAGCCSWLPWGTWLPKSARLSGRWRGRLAARSILSRLIGALAGRRTGCLRRGIGIGWGEARILRGVRRI